MIAETRGFLAAQTAVETFPIFAKLNVPVLGRKQAERQFSRGGRCGDAAVQSPLLGEPISRIAPHRCQTTSSLC
jgi:hypothetical protein